MSTRAIYTFFGDQSDAPRHVYKHHDGYPTGAQQWINAALAYAWPLPRYENDEFAAAFVAANKNHYRDELIKLWRKPKKTAKDRAAIKHCEDMARFSGGCIRLIAAPQADMPANEAAKFFACDIEYRYEVRCLNGELWIKVFTTNYWDALVEEEIWSGPLDKMAMWASASKNEDQAA